MGLNVIRLLGQGPSISNSRSLEFAQCLEGIAQIVMVRGHPAVQRDGLFDQFHRAVIAAGLVRNHT